MLNRRNLLASLGFGLAAPAIIRTPGLLMQVRRAPVQPRPYPHAGFMGLNFVGSVLSVPPQLGDVYYDGECWITLGVG